MNNYCVYIHTNLENNKKYVGITKRDPHLRWGSHGINYSQQPKFYNAIKKYGWDNFKHEIIIQNLTEEEALLLETYYITLYNTIENGYNILLDGIKSYPRNKPVYCITTDKVYDSITEAAKFYQTDPYKIISNCKGKSGKVKGTEWTYWDTINNCPCLKEEFIPKSKFNPKTAIPIYCIELNKEYNSIKEAARMLNLDSSSLTAAINGKRNGCGGYHFVKTSEKYKIPEVIKKKTGKTRKILCIETNTIFNSGKEAALFYNVAPETIIKACQGKIKKCKNLTFKYLDEVNYNFIRREIVEDNEL